MIVNLVDTVRGKDKLASTIPAFLEYANLPYTGCGMTGMVIGSNRHLFKELLGSNDIPTPEYKFIKDLRSNTPPPFDPPYIAKLNESGGSMGIDNKAVKETANQIMKKVEELSTSYKIPILVEKFIDGPEITAVVFDDGKTRHVLLAEKRYRVKPDGKYGFTSIESYDNPNAAKFHFVEEELAKEGFRAMLKSLRYPAFLGLCQVRHPCGQRDNDSILYRLQSQYRPGAGRPAHDPGNGHVRDRLPGYSGQFAE